MEITFFATREKVNIETKQFLETKQLQFKNSGGQGRIYLFLHKGGKYAIKVIPEAGDLARKLKAIYDRIRKRNQPVILKHRLLPIAQGIGRAAEFGFKTLGNSSVLLFVYNWVDGDLLFQYAKGNHKNISEIATKVIDGLQFFEDIGIVHGDLFPDNFIVNNDYVYLIDIDGAGMLSSNRKEWTWTPSVIGKSFPGFIKPPEFESNPNIYTQRWEAVILVYFILRQGSSPFFFLKRGDEVALENFIKNTDKNNLAWPPLGIEKMESNYLNEDCLQNIEEIRKHFSKDDRITQMLFSTFVHGFSEPEKRPSFGQIKKRLGL